MQFLSEMQTAISRQHRKVKTSSKMEDFEQVQKAQGVLTSEKDYIQDIRRYMFKIIKDKYKTFLHSPRSRVTREISSS
jgi:hypothetical protein